MDRFRRAMAETEDMEAQEKEDDSKYFNLEKERLEKERDELQRKLRRLRAHHADTERDEKEKKTREVNKVQDEVEQYDAIMTEKRGVYEEQKLVRVGRRPLAAL